MRENTPEFDKAVEGNKDIWIPACGGYETVFMSRSGVRLLYCFNPQKIRHAYLNVDTDIIIPDNEIDNYLQMR